MPTPSLALRQTIKNLLESQPPADLLTNRQLWELLEFYSYEVVCAATSRMNRSGQIKGVRVMTMPTVAVAWGTLKHYEQHRALPREQQLDYVNPEAEWLKLERKRLRKNEAARLRKQRQRARLRGEPSPPPLPKKSSSKLEVRSNRFPSIWAVAQDEPY